jgi:hypothetical protein
VSQSQRRWLLRSGMSSYTIRVTVLGDPQGATFIASKFVPENQDLGSEADAAVETN